MFDTCHGLISRGKGANCRWKPTIQAWAKSRTGPLAYRCTHWRWGCASSADERSGKRKGDKQPRLCLLTVTTPERREAADAQGHFRETSKCCVESDRMPEGWRMYADPEVSITLVPSNNNFWLTFGILQKLNLISWFYDIKDSLHSWTQWNLNTMSRSKKATAINNLTRLHESNIATTNLAACIFI